MTKILCSHCDCGWNFNRVETEVKCLGSSGNALSPGCFFFSKAEIRRTLKRGSLLGANSTLKLKSVVLMFFFVVV